MLVSRLQRASPEFTAFWERHDVLGAESRTKLAQHPQVGLVRMEYTNLWLDQRRGMRIIVFRPADDASRTRIETLYESLTQGVNGSR